MHPIASIFSSGVYEAIHVHYQGADLFKDRFGDGNFMCSSFQKLSLAFPLLLTAHCIRLMEDHSDQVLSMYGNCQRRIFAAEVSYSEELERMA
jgi:hypothetical protein